MSGRHTRDSTSRLRNYYHSLPRINRSKSRTRPRKNSSAMAAADPNSAHVPGGAPGVVQVPSGSDARPNTDPPGGGDEEGDGVPNGTRRDGQAAPVSPQIDMADYLRRLQLLEEKFKDRDARASRATSRASSRGSDQEKHRGPPRHRSPARPDSRSGSHRRSPGSRATSARRTRTPPARSGYSPTSIRSRSQRASPPRRRSPSRHRRRTSSRSRSHRRRSSSRATRSRSRRRSRSPSRSRRRRMSARSPSRAHTRERSPRSLRADTASRDEAARALEAQYPAMGAPTGEYLHKSRATLEPYRNLPPDIKTRAGERRSRKDLSLPEHLCGLLLMATKVIDPASELHGLVEHAAQVAQDAVTIQWPTVRAWSQACLAHIQDDGAGWRDAALFKDERMRLSWCKGKSQPDTPIPCPAFNTATCPERHQHSGEGRTWLHLCAVCYHGINDTVNSHTSQGCRKKSGLKLVTDEGRNDGRRRFNNNNN